MKDTLSSVGRAASRFFSGTLLSRISGFLRDLSMAYAFGTKPAVAAFLVAFRLSHLFRRIFGEGALQSAFTPLFESYRHQRPIQAAYFFRDLFCSLTLFLSVLIALMMGGIALFDYSFSFSTQTHHILHYSLWLLPSLLFICLYGVNASFLQCEKHYFLTSLAPVFFNLTWILGVVLTRHLTEELAMSWLSIWVCIGCLLQFAVTVPQVLTALKRLGLQTFFSEISFFLGPLRRFYKPLCLGILGVSATQINNALDAVFAQYAEAEGPAYLWYAIRLQQLPLALFGIAVANALMPPLSRAVKAQDFTLFHELLQFGLNRALYLMIPLSTLFIFLGHEYVILLFQHGDFTRTSVDGTFQALWAYSIGLLPMTMTLILAPAFYAHHQFKITAWTSVLTVITNILLNAFFIFGLHMGATSVALATSLSAWLNLVVLIAAFNRSYGELKHHQLVKSGILSLGACIAGGGSINILFTKAESLMGIILQTLGFLIVYCLLISWKKMKGRSLFSPIKSLFQSKA